MKEIFFHNQKKWIVPVFFVFVQCALQAQPIKQFSSHSFSVKNGLLADHILDIAEDDRGFIWLSFAAGLQRFDGSGFETIFPQQGLPETNHPHFFKLQDGTLWLSYHSGISAYNTITNQFEVIYKTPESDLKDTYQTGPYEIPPVMPALETANAVWCWSSPEQQFIAIDKSTHKVIDTFKIKGKLPVVNNFKRSNSGTLFLVSNEGIEEINFATKRILHRYHFPEIKNYVYNYVPLKNDKLLLATNKGIYEADLASGATELLRSYPADIVTGNIGRISFCYLSDNLYGIAIDNQLYIFDIATRDFLYRMVNRQNQNFFNPGYITFCMPDHFHNLWLLSHTGLRKINLGMRHIKYYGVTDVRKNFARCIFADKKANLVMVGSLLNHLSVFDTSGHLLKQFSIPPATGEGQVSCILKAAKNKYLIFADGKYSVYLLNTAMMRLSPLYGGINSRYYPLKVMGDTTAILMQGYDGVVKVVYSPKKFKLRHLIRTTVLCALIDDKGRMWIGGKGKYFLLKGETFSDKSVFYLKKDIDTKCFFQDSEKNIWLGTEDGLYKINSNTGAVLDVYNKKNGLADETIYSIQEDNNGNIWFSTNKGISCIYKNGHIINLYASDGLQGNEFNTNVSAKADDGELFFGGTDGVNSFFPQQIKIPDENPVVLLQHIKVMDAEWRTDTAAWDTHCIRLPYTKNIISFNFIALGRYASDLYHYSYKMQGIDKGWVNAGTRGQARYALPPGNYVFEYGASIAGEKIGNAKYISIIITPPFWQTIWFKLIVIIVAVTLLWFTMYLYNKRKYQKKLQQVRMQQGIEQERHRISRDLHDNIGAYTTALVAGTEQLNDLAAKEDVHQTAENISANAKNIIASLQETIWVLNNDKITITDFADRFKVYAKKILQHKPGIQIRFNESIEKDTVLSPIEALNVFRIIQEALHNSLKHNSLKHSGALLISVELISNNKTIRLSLKDNGNGFEVNQPSIGNGLFNMRHRCEESGYQLSITSDEGGTTVSLEKNHSFAV